MMVVWESILGSNYPSVSVHVTIGTGTIRKRKGHLHSHYIPRRFLEPDAAQAGCAIGGLIFQKIQRKFEPMVKTNNGLFWCKFPKIPNLYRLIFGVCENISVVISRIDEPCEKFCMRRTVRNIRRNTLFHRDARLDFFDIIQSSFNI